jgi:pyruvate dehydrogenase E1 component alpha subunit
MIPAIAIVGGGIPVATGAALALKMQKRSQVVACFFGEGATSEGAFHEAVNMGALWNLPVIYVCENNLYGASTRIDKVTRLEHIADRAAGYCIRGETVDGNDVLAVYEATRRAAEECRAGKGPVLLECLTYRITGHSRRDPCHYQPKQEKEAWLRREPLKVFVELLIQRDDISANDLEQIRDNVTTRIEHAIEVARQEPEPAVDDLTTDVFA